MSNSTNDTIDPRALWTLSYGVYVVASRLEERCNGLIVNTVFQVTAEPPRIAVSVSKNNYTHDMIMEGGTISVSVLEEDTPMTFIGLFGFHTGREVDKLSQTSFKPGQTGCPLVTENTLAVIEGRIINSLDVGSHTIFVADVVGGELLKRGTPLTYVVYHEKKKGKEPPNAPLYRGDADASDDKEEESESTMKKYVCGVCGYTYDPETGDPDSGIDPGTAFENLPEDWCCPVCGVGKDEFAPE